MPAPLRPAVIVAGLIAVLLIATSSPELAARPLDEASDQSAYGSAERSLQAGDATLDPASFAAPGGLDPLRTQGPLPPPSAPDPAAQEAFLQRILARHGLKGVSDPRISQETREEVIEDCIREDMAGRDETELDDAPGASIAISVDGETVFAKGYGVRSLEGQEPVDTETIFRIGSTTKQLTVAALMQLVDAGQVSVDAPITDYLPDLRLAAPYQASDLTAHHLMTHSSGIPDTYWVLDGSISLTQWMPYASLYQLHAPPGRIWNYSNPNFTLPGLIVERVSGKPYYDYMADELFARAAMSSTTFSSEQVMATGNYAIGHDAGQALPLNGWDLPAIAPAGTAFSTPSDMIRWANLLMDGGGDVLSAASAAAMQEAHMPVEIYGWDHYGYGIFVTDYRDVDDEAQMVKVMDHGGNIPGFSSQLFWVPERDVAVSVLSNTFRSLDVAAYCATAVWSGVRRQSTDDLKTGPEDWGLFEGTYAMANTAQWPFTAQVQLISDTLHMDYSDFGRSPVIGRNFPMIHALADTFTQDSDRDGQPDPILAFSFLRDRETGERIEYLRDRLIVGHRVGQFPASVQIEGAGCADIEIQAERDMPELSVSAAGLSAWRPEIGLSVSQDDPTNPSSASFKRAFQVDGGMELFMVAVSSLPTVTLSSYLLYDVDNDGNFVFPNEVAIAGLANGPGLNMAVSTTPLPAGSYQLWVQGLDVPAGEASFNLVPLVTEGDHLRLENAPEALADGDAHSLQVCAEDVADLEGPAQGSVAFRYGLPPRVVRVMVDWMPASADPNLYLPLLFADWQIPEN